MFMRSILFTPATRLDRLPKGRAVGPDLIALDLEDGVGANAKSVARRALDEFSATGFGGDQVATAVRINAPSTPDGILDLAMMMGWQIWPAVVILPKVESPYQVRQINDLMRANGHDSSLLITLETAAGIARAAKILRSARPNSAVAYGSADHTAETGGTMSATSLAWARGKVVNAAAIANIPALDGVWLNYRDQNGLLEECRLVRDMGFAGKIAIHPDQIATINNAFSPSKVEIETARAMIKAYDAAGGGAFSFNGKMVDAPVLARAKRILNTNKQDAK